MTQAQYADWVIKHDGTLAASTREEQDSDSAKLMVDLRSKMAVHLNGEKWKDHSSPIDRPYSETLLPSGALGTRPCDHR